MAIRAVFRLAGSPQVVDSILPACQIFTLCQTFSEAKEKRSIVFWFRIVATQSFQGNYLSTQKTTYHLLPNIISLSSTTSVQFYFYFQALSAADFFI